MELNVYMLIMNTVLISMPTHGFSLDENGCSCNIFHNYNDDGFLTCEIKCYQTLENLIQQVELCRYNTGLYVVRVHLDVRNFNEDEYFGVANSGANIISISVHDSNITIIPKELYELIAVRQVDIMNNKYITKINLNRFLYMPVLHKINASHNGIVYLETETVRTTPIETVAIIDLSHNSIESIPMYCFSHFWKLNYLDLSHNFLTSFEAFTLVGTMRLQTLHLSNNKLISIGLGLLAVQDLQELTLDNNKLTELEGNIFGALQNLRKLNISRNMIQNIKDHTFDKISRIEEIDLSHNHINVITDGLFRNNTLLRTLDLSYNNISLVKKPSYKNITNLHIDHAILGSVTRNTFQGVFVEELNLVGGYITTLGDEAFSALSSTLLRLNLSCNSIQHISKSAFNSLHRLNTLDLSNNSLSNVNFETRDLKNLSTLLLRNNKINKIITNSFQYLTSLNMLDLSFNSIIELKSKSFENLNNLKTLILNNNYLGIIGANTFNGLIALQRIELTNTSTAIYRNESFARMNSVTYVNSSFGHISLVEYNTFLNTGKIEILDLSYNLLDNFEVNTTTIANIKEIYLNDNRLKVITSKTFYALSSLRKLNLANNKIVSVDAYAFQHLSRAVYLNLFSNNITPGMFKFEYANTSIVMLDARFCQITDIDNVFVYNVKNLSKLNLSSNRIKYIDRFSFKNMPSLTWLDLSCNAIKDIHPGSFRGTEKLSSLNLNSNSIKTIQFGVLDGVIGLKLLNLSNNYLIHFNPKLLHSSLRISTLSLDNNAISNIDPFAFVYTNIKILSVGGNPISCDIFANLIIKHFNHFTVTAENLDYYAENVNGITCLTTIDSEKSFDVAENSML